MNDLLGSYEVRFPAETPVTPPAIGLSHAQWCEKIMDKSLPGDGYGRECFDTLPRFVVGDPSARFETHTPLTYETNGETGQPLWTEIFSHILKECAYLTAFNTVYVMVDTRNLKAHETAQDGLRGGTVVFNWWGPNKRKRSSFISRQLKRLAYTGCIPPGQERLSWLLWWLSFLVSTLSCWTVIACQLPSSRQQTSGRRVS